MKSNLEGRVAVVTGGASGIGRCAALQLAEEGARVAVVDLDADAAQAVAEEIATHWPATRATAIGCDVSDRAAFEASSAAVREQLGRVDVLATCAGFSLGGSILDSTEANWDCVFAVNVKGTLFWMQAVLPDMVARQGGSIVTIASQLAHAGGRDNAAYIASKGAILSLTRTASLEHAEAGIRINAVSPGATDTPLLRRSMGRRADPGGAAAASQRRHAMGRFGKPEEIAAAIVFLAGDGSMFMTGSEMVVDGGWLAA